MSTNSTLAGGAIPAEYLLTLMFFVFFLSIVIIAYCGFKCSGWVNSWKSVHESHFWSSPVVSATTLLAYRSVVSLYAWFVIAYDMKFGFVEYKYYTVWNYTLLATYFTCGVVHSVRKTTGNKVSAFSRFTLVIFEIEICLVLLVDTVAWSLLYPVVGPSFINFTSVNMHAINFFFVAIEFALNSLEINPRHVIFVITWVSAYSICAILYFIATGRYFLFP
jgi:hypothetical protein